MPEFVADGVRRPRVFAWQRVRFHQVTFPLVQACAALLVGAASPAHAAPPANTGTYNNNTAITVDVTSNTGTIDNNAPGVWTGKVLSNQGRINNNLGAAWAGTVVTNIGEIFNHGQWTGNIESNDDHSIYNDGASALWWGTVANNSQVINTNGARWQGNVVGNNNAIFNDQGSIWNGDVLANGGGSNDLTLIDNFGAWGGAVQSNFASIYNDAGSWSGDVISNGGGAMFAEIDNSALWTGKVTSNGGGIFNEAGATWLGEVVSNGVGGNYAEIDNYGAWAGDVDTNASWIYNLGGTWTGKVLGNTGYLYNNFIDSNSNPGGINHAIWNGDIIGNSGRIVNETGGFWNGDVKSNAGTITNLGIWTGSFTSAGTVKAENRINGAFTNNGLLQLTGSLAGITTLTNNGTLELRGSGAVQTLTATNVDFGAGSIYGIDVDTAGHSDTVVATTASLGGTVQVKASVGGPYNFMSHYVILSAPNISGTFAGVTTDLAFLDPRLSYVDPQVVALDLVRNDQGFAQVGQTPNQKSAAAAAAALGAGNPIYGAILWLTEAQAAQAFDALSGEAYASLNTASMENANILAKAVTGHLDQSFDAVGDDASSVSFYAQPYTPQASARHTSGVWGELHGVHSDFATPGFAGLSSTVGGVSLGLDGRLGDWRLGAVLQAGTAGMIVDERATFATSVDYGAGLYGGTEWGDTRLLLGALYTRHDIHSSRTVTFPGFADALSADYSADTAQAFAELSHQFDFGAVSLQPFANLTFVRHSTDAFTETGGAAALSNQSSLIDATFATLGFGVDRQFVVGDDMLLTASATLGWRHAFASRPNLTSAFAGGAGFNIVGAPIAADLFVLSAGLDLDVNAATTVDLTYNGQIGSGTQTHALRATWDTRF